MAASRTDTVDQEFTQFRGQLSQFGLRQPAQISRNVDGLEEGILAWWCFCHLPQFIPSRPGLVMGCGSCSVIATGPRRCAARRPPGAGGGFAIHAGGGAPAYSPPPPAWPGGAIPADFRDTVL